MIETPKYQHRKHDFLLRRMKDVLNLFQMRDWDVTLDTSDNPPDKFADDNNSDCSAKVEYELQYLKAFIWLSPKRSQKDDVDPLFYLYHELAHLYQVVHNEEVRCNIVASILCNTVGK